MNINWQDATEHPVPYFLAGILLLIFGAFGIGPLRAVSRRLTQTEQTRTVGAQVDQNMIRRSDAAAESHQIIAQRAMADAETARTEKHTAIAAAQKELHDFRNKMQEEIARISLDARNAIRAAENRATEAIEEARVAAQHEVALELGRRAVAEQRAIKAEAQVALLAQQVKHLERRLDQALGFDPTRTEG